MEAGTIATQTTRLFIKRMEHLFGVIGPKEGQQGRRPRRYLVHIWTRGVPARAPRPPISPPICADVRSVLMASHFPKAVSRQRKLPQPTRHG